MNTTQQERYSRHIILDEINEEGQQKLLNAKVLVIGAGGLGSPVLQYLTAAGIGTLGIMDHDTISISNLQRQIIYCENDIGKLKCELAKEYLQNLNSDVKIEIYPYKFDEKNGQKIISNYDLVIGATDNFISRKSIDKICLMQKKPFVHGSIHKYEGQIAVFNYKGGPSYNELFPDSQDTGNKPAGVLGILPGIIGCMQANEAIKIILGIGNILSGKLLIYNALKSECKILNF